MVLIDTKEFQLLLTELGTSQWDSPINSLEVGELIECTLFFGVLREKSSSEESLSGENPFESTGTSSEEPFAGNLVENQAVPTGKFSLPTWVNSVRL